MAVTQQGFSLKESAKLLGCHRETLRKAITRGDLRSCKTGRNYRVSAIELLNY